MQDSANQLDITGTAKRDWNSIRNFQRKLRFRLEVEMK